MTAREHLIADREMRQILAGLELISHGSVARWNSSGGGHGTGDRLYPPGERLPPHLRYRDRYLRCQTDEGRQAVKTEARTELEALTRRTAPIPAQASTGDARTDRIVSDEFAGATPEQVSEAFAEVTAAQVRRLRHRHGLDTETGEAHDRDQAKALPLEVRIDRARAMLAQGCSVRQVEFACGLARDTITRLRRAA